MYIWHFFKNLAKSFSILLPCKNFILRFPEDTHRCYWQSETEIFSVGVPLGSYKFSFLFSGLIFTFEDL